MKIKIQNNLQTNMCFTQCLQNLHTFGKMRKISQAGDCNIQSLLKCICNCNVKVDTTHKEKKAIVQSKKYHFGFLY